MAETFERVTALAWKLLVEVLLPEPSKRGRGTLHPPSHKVPAALCPDHMKCGLHVPLGPSLLAG
jgi:hypothetical protein